MNEETGTIIRDLMGFNDEIQTLKKKAEDAVKTISKLLEKTKGLYLCSNSVFALWLALSSFYKETVRGFADLNTAERVTELKTRVEFLKRVAGGQDENQDEV
jgi:hypothetical protein